MVVNGRYDPLRSSPATPLSAVTRGSLAEVLRTRPDLVEPVLARVADGSRAFTALNSAFLMDGAAVVVPDGVVLQEPVEIVHLHAAGSQPTVVHPRTLIIDGANSRFSVAETYLGVDGEVYFVNAVTEIVLAENAEIEHCRVQLDGDSAYHIGALQVRQARKSGLKIRGYNIRAVGPRCPNGVVLGGDRFFLFNAEYYIDIVGPLRFLFFFDAGQAYLKGEQIDLGQLRYSTGAELRFIMPVLNVPFRLIYAYNPNRDPFVPRTTFKFAVGTTF